MLSIRLNPPKTPFCHLARGFGGFLLANFLPNKTKLDKIRQKTTINYVTET